MKTNDSVLMPPDNNTAEASLIGALIRDGDRVYADVRAIVGPDDFYLDAHRKLFSAIEVQLAEQKPCDVVILYTELQRRGQVEDVGGAIYIADCLELAPTGAEAIYHAQIVKEKSTARRLIHLCGEMIRDAHDGAPADELISSFETRIFAVADTAVTERLTTLPKSIDELMDELCNRKPDDAKKFIRSGIERLDHLIGGARAGQLIVVAARPSVGKSAFAQQWAMNAAKNGYPTLMFSLEMSHEEIAERALAQGCQVPLNFITGSTSMDQTPTINRLVAGREGCRVPITIDDNPGHNANTIAAIARRSVRRHGIQFVVVDYLGLIDHEGYKSDNAATRIGNTTRRLKVLARTLKIPVVLLCQLNRDIEKRGDTKPQLSDLRDSGSIEQDADIVIMLHPQPIPQGTAPPEQEIDFCVEKQRRGPKGVAKAMYQRATLTFRDKPSNW